MAAATLTPREVAELSGAPKRLIEKAIEEHILTVRRRTRRSLEKRSLRVLPAHAVAYAALMAKLDHRAQTPAHRQIGPLEAV
jgi:hypothetical protein